MKKSPQDTEADRLQDAIATAEVLFSLGQSEAQAIATELTAKARLHFAQAICSAVMAVLWNGKTASMGCNWAIRESLVAPTRKYSGLVHRVANALTTLSRPRAGFLIGQFYTALLPEAVRKGLGAYYTPPPLVDRLMTLVDESGLDWTTARVIDPACGGAAFLASAAPKLVAASKAKPGQRILEDVEARLLGVEVDEFAAWMSMVLLDLSLLEVAILALASPNQPNQRSWKTLALPI